METRRSQEAVGKVVEIFEIDLWHAYCLECSSIFEGLNEYTDHLTEQRSIYMYHVSIVSRQIL